MIANIIGLESDLNTLSREIDHSCKKGYLKLKVSVYLYQQVKVKNEQGLGSTRT